MNRTRWSIGLLSAVATIAAVWPITSLFDSEAWFQPAVAVVALVALLGMILRGLVRSRLVVVLVQLVVTSYLILLRFGSETFAYQLPTTETVELANSYGLTALETIQKYVAPAPLNAGVTFCLVVATALVAIAVDAAAATWRSPAAAGLPLLTAYLITAANGSDALKPQHFMAPVLAWLAMLHTTARGRFGRWSTTTASDLEDIDDGSHDRTAMWSFSSGALRLGVIAALAAIILPAFIPHFPPRYLSEGLGRSASGGGTGTVGFSDTVDLERSLRSTDQSPVLTYTTTGPGNVPLKAYTRAYYSNGSWPIVGRRGPVPETPVPLPAPSLRKDYVMTVTSNRLQAPEIAAPYPIIGFDPKGVGWRIDTVTRDVLVAEDAPDYSLTYAQVTATPAGLRSAGEPSSPDILPEDLALPDRSRARIVAWAKEAIGSATNPYDRAVAIQDHLRDTTRYTYTLDLGEPVRDRSGRLVDPIEAFYETRRGYCIHFATAMILMARAEGIPARLAVGFLPGTRTGNTYTVRQSDAHAWPELYFEGYGWLRFEPTPAGRAGLAPAYTDQRSGSSGSAGQGGQEENPTSSATTTAQRPGIDVNDSTGAGGPAGSASRGFFTPQTLVTLTAVLVGLLAAFLMPLTAKLAGVRRRRAARDRQELMEVEWDELTSHLRDLGLSPPAGGTLRQWRQHYVTSGHLDPENVQAMGRVTATLEQTRYARPEHTSPEQAEQLHRDIRSIRRRISQTRDWRTRVRSFVWPSAGVAFWRRLPDSLRPRRGGEKTDH